MAERLQDVMTSVAYNDLLGTSNIIQFCCLFGFFNVVAHATALEAGFVLIGNIFNSVSIPLASSPALCHSRLCFNLLYD